MSSEVLLCVYVISRVPLFSWFCVYLVDPAVFVISRVPLFSWFCVYLADPAVFVLCYVRCKRLINAVLRPIT